jgi:subtilisin family serine protease
MRYVIANRRAGKSQPDAQVASRASLMSALNLVKSSSKILADHDTEDPSTRRVVILEAEPGEIQAKRSLFAPDVIIEPEILFYPAAEWCNHTHPSDFLTIETSASQNPAGARFNIHAQAPGYGSLPDARVTLYARGPANATRAWTGKTDSAGNIDFTVDPGFLPAAAVIVPAHSFWPMIVRAPTTGLVVDCPGLPQQGPYEWWHRAVGIEISRRPFGNGIKIGIIDTGCGPNVCLSHVNAVGAFIDGQRLPASDIEDVDGHGTHTSGVIGARPSNPGEYAGIAEGAELCAARVFAPGKGASQADIANAIDVLSREYECDLLNLSLGGKERSEILEDAIEDALERGALCVCAAGNNAGDVNYPAAYQSCVAVSAIGLAGWGPAGSLAESRLPDKPDFHGADNYYLANFSCMGAEVTCAAPGVGIISTVPTALGQAARYAAMDGTSMASPAACGTLATILARNPTYKTMSRDVHRARAARGLLVRNCRPLGLVSEYEGRGIPFA